MMKLLLLKLYANRIQPIKKNIKLLKKHKEFI
jgi:hypothetical protein